MHNWNKSWVFFLGWTSKVTRKIYTINIKTHSHYVLCLLWPLEWDSPICSSCGTLNLNWIHVVTYWTQVSINNLQELKKHKALIWTARITNNSMQEATAEVIHNLNLMQGIPFVFYNIKQELNFHLDNFINGCCSSDLIKQESCFIKPEDVMEKISQNVYHSYTITPHHIPKQIHHQFHHGKSLRSCTTLLTISINLSRLFMAKCIKRKGHLKVIWH